MSALIILDRDGELRQDAVVDDLTLPLDLRRHVIAVRLRRFRCAQLLQRRQWVEVAEPFVRFRRFRRARGDVTTTRQRRWRYVHRGPESNAVVMDEEIFPIGGGQLGQIVEIGRRGHLVARWVDVELAQFRCDDQLADIVRALMRRIEPILEQARKLWFHKR